LKTRRGFRRRGLEPKKVPVKKGGSKSYRQPRLKLRVPEMEEKNEETREVVGREEVDRGGGRMPVPQLIKPENYVVALFRERAGARGGPWAENW